MVIRALDVVQQCNTSADGEAIYARLVPLLRSSEDVSLSFAGVRDVPSSFVNAAIVSLLRDFDPDFLRTHLTLTDANSQIADMVRRCMSNGLRRAEPS